MTDTGTRDRQIGGERNRQRELQTERQTLTDTGTRDRQIGGKRNRESCRQKDRL